MTRLIDADELRNDWLQNGQNEYVYDTNAFLASIDDAPTVDAVEVVRCRDCIHKRINAFSKESMIVYCPINYTVKQYDDFCSYGDRRDGD